MDDVNLYLSPIKMAYSTCGTFSLSYYFFCYNSLKD